MDRTEQVNQLREIAATIRFGGVGDGTPQEQVEFYLSEYGKPGDWFDEHDKQLLVQMVADE